MDKKGSDKITFLKHFIKDIKINGIGYIKSEVVAKQIRELDSSIEITYSKEERLYTATYDKDVLQNG